MSRKVNQATKTGRSFLNNNDDQIIRMNSRGDALEYRRAEQIGLEVGNKKLDNISNAVLSESSGFEGSVGPNNRSDCLEILDDRRDLRVKNKPNYIGQMKVNEL